MSHLKEWVMVAEKASSDFERSRTLSPENEHGYIAEAQMLIELLEHVASSSGDLFQFLTHHVMFRPTCVKHWTVLRVS